jgi:hypothetical protein
MSENDSFLDLLDEIENVKNTFGLNDGEEDVFGSRPVVSALDFILERHGR